MKTLLYRREANDFPYPDSISYCNVVIWNYTAANPTINVTRPERRDTRKEVWPDAAALNVPEGCNNLSF